MKRSVFIIAFVCDGEYSPFGQSFRQTFILHFFPGDLQPKTSFSVVHLHRRRRHDCLLRRHNYCSFRVDNTTAWSLYGF